MIYLRGRPRFDGQRFYLRFKIRWGSKRNLTMAILARRGS